jgi:hypothetical protein
VFSINGKDRVFLIRELLVQTTWPTHVRDDVTQRAGVPDALCLGRSDAPTYRRHVPLDATDLGPRNCKRQGGGGACRVQDLVRRGNSITGSCPLNDWEPGVANSRAAIKHIRALVNRASTAARFQFFAGSFVSSASTCARI